MNALRQLGFLKLNLRPERATPEHEHRVIELFRNRAELKKAYGGLEEETYRLKDLVKQQEAATQRVQDMLNELEARLSTNETSRTACAGPRLVLSRTPRLFTAINGALTDPLTSQRSRDSLGSSRSRNPSPRRLRPSTAIAIAMPG